MMLWWGGMPPNGQLSREGVTFPRRRTNDATGFLLGDGCGERVPRGRTCDQCNRAGHWWPGRDTGGGRVLRAARCICHSRDCGWRLVVRHRCDRRTVAADVVVGRRGGPGRRAVCCPGRECAGLRRWRVCQGRISCTTPRHRHARWRAGGPRCGGGLIQMSATLISTIHCPNCHHDQQETMPTDACQWFYDCKGCGTVLRPKPGDCCVFCSYGDVPCPPIQDARAEGCSSKCCGPP